MQKAAAQKLRPKGWNRLDNDHNTPLISVIMPCYHAAAYLAQAVASVQAQTVQDWELLLLDDGSQDNTAAIAQALADADARIRFLPAGQNLGVAKTRNRGLRLARGQWAAFLDSDDVWHPDKLKRQLELAERTGADLIYTAYDLWTPEKKRTYRVPAQIDYRGLLRENVIGCSTVLVRRSVLGDDPFSPTLYHEDYALWLRLLREGCRAAGCTESLADWRVSPQGRSFRKANAAKARWRIYRRAEGLPLLRAAVLFAGYALRGVRKHAPLVAQRL